MKIIRLGINTRPICEYVLVGIWSRKGPTSYEQKTWAEVDGNPLCPI